MQHAELLAAVRRVIHGTFSDFGVTPADEFRESILLREDHYCGRRFQACGIQAIWFIEEDEIKFYHQDGTVACVLPALEHACDTETEQRKAA